MRTTCGLLCAALIVLATLGMRWVRVDAGGGRHLHPWPDALEYACGAQSIRQAGTYHLQVGPYRVQPRYPPGWPLLLVPFLAGGLAAEQLCLVPALFDALHALLLAALVFGLLAGGLAGDERIDPRRRFWLALAAAGTAGLGWACTPVSVDHGRFALSDPAAAACATATVAVLLWAVLRGPRSRPRDRWLLLAAGFAAGCAAACRPVTAALLVVPVGSLLAYQALAGTPRRAGRSAARLVAGALVPTALVCGLLVRSGHGAWEWWAYEFWAPGVYGELGTTFRIEHLVSADHDQAAHALAGDGRISNGTLGLAMLCGLPLSRETGLGSYWPILAWVVGGVLVQAGTRGRRWAWVPVLGLAAWPLGHLLLFGSYAFASGRFYLGVAPWPWVLLTLAAGWWCIRTRRPLLAMTVSGLVVVATFLAVRAEVQRIPWSPTADPSQVWFDRTRAEFPAWLALPAAQRAGRVAPFHPLVAQAVGWLPPAAADRIGEWGRLDRAIEHVDRLRRRGVIPAAATSLDGAPR